MASDRQYYGAHGIGKWDIQTKRYVPIGGGSRSRLALEITGVRPYRGFAGVDTVEREKIDKISTLYSRMDEGLDKISKSGSYLARERALEAAGENPPPAVQTPQPEPDEPVTGDPVEQAIQEQIAAVIPEVEQAIQEEIAAGIPGVELAIEEEIAAEIPAEETIQQASPVAPEPQQKEAQKYPGDEVLFTFEL